MNTSRNRDMMAICWSISPSGHRGTLMGYLKGNIRVLQNTKHSQHIIYDCNVNGDIMLETNGSDYIMLYIPDERDVMKLVAQGNEIIVNGKADVMIDNDGLDITGTTTDQLHECRYADYDADDNAEHADDNAERDDEINTVYDYYTNGNNINENINENYDENYEEHDDENGAIYDYNYDDDIL